jgi:pyruvate dehydrogenase E2 component (dihydrolipoamide acetyltransferase)
VNGTIVEQTRMRAGIARRMAESKQHAPHFYVQTEVTVNPARDRLAQLNAPALAPRLTMTAALVRACVQALRAQPRFNSVWTEDGLLQVDEVNLGIAIALEDGLVAPALLAADQLDASATAAALSDLAERARSQRLRPAEISSATFTLTNLGMFDVSAFTAIITPPQVAILATARPVERWVFAEGRPELRSVMTATLSADHRALDGVDAARFLGAFKSALEDAATLLPPPIDAQEANP